MQLLKCFIVNPEKHLASAVASDFGHTHANKIVATRPHEFAYIVGKLFRLSALPFTHLHFANWDDVFRCLCATLLLGFEFFVKFMDSFTVPLPFLL